MNSEASRSWTPKLRKLWLKSLGKRYSCVVGSVCQPALPVYLSRLSVPLPLSLAPSSQSLWGDTESKAEYTWLYYLELTNCLSLSLTTWWSFGFPCMSPPGCVSCSHSLVSSPRLDIFFSFFLWYLPILVLGACSQLGISSPPRELGRAACYLTLKSSVVLFPVLWLCS